MKKILSFIIALTMVFSIGSTSTHALDSVGFSVDNFKYELIIQDDKNIVYVTDTNTNERNTIVYDRNSEVLTIDGKEETYEYNIDTSNPTTRSIDTYGPLKVNFSVSFKNIGLLAGVILAVGSMAVTVATCGVSTGLFATAVKTIFNWYTAGDLASYVFPGATVSGYFKFDLQHNNSTNLSHYANRSLTYRFGKGSYKTYSFGSGGWWSSTRPINYSRDILWKTYLYVS